MMTKPMNNLNQMDALLSAVNAAGSILLFSHLSPDGDTLGSALALRLRLERLGKRVVNVMDGEVPDNLSFLPSVEEIKKPVDVVGEFDLAISVDVSCEERMGASLALFSRAKMTAVIDHHGTNNGFGQMNVIDGEAAAAAIVVYRLLKKTDLPVSKEEAICLYTALATDTGNFVYDSTDAESFCIMGALMEAGLPLDIYSRQLFRQKKLSFVELLGKVLPSLRLSAGGAIAGLYLRLADMRAVHANTGHTDGIIDYAIDIEGVKLAYFLRETEEGRVKMSLRALAPYRIDDVAATFGGGGHKLASGCLTDLPLEQAVLAIEAALKKAYDGGLAE